VAGIPEGRLLSVLRGYVSAAVGCPPARVAEASRFPDGNRHAVYKVSYLDPAGATTDLVVRVCSGSGPDDCSRAEWEARVLGKTGGTAAPLLYDFRRRSEWFDTPAMCMQFVPGHQMELGSATPAEIERLGSVVRWVHDRPVDDLVEGHEGEDVEDMAAYAERRLRSIVSTLIWVRDPVPGVTQDRLRAAADAVGTTLARSRAARSFHTGEALALQHGDIGPGNVRWGPDPVLIDWEYARLGDPADEIAYVFDQNGLTGAQREEFWRGYRVGTGGGAALAQIIDRVGWWEPVTLLGSALWWVERWVRRAEADAAGTADPEVPREPGYYSRRVMSRLARLEDRLSRDGR
jgi:thiamine kinase-like enzyme